MQMSISPSTIAETRDRSDEQRKGTLTIIASNDPWQFT